LRKPTRPRQSRQGLAQVAQSVEQRTENPRVGGSIPPLGTTPLSKSYLINHLEPDFDPTADRRWARWVNFVLALLAQRKEGHPFSGKTFPVCLASIEFGLLDCVPTEHRHELMGSRAVLSGDGCTCFAQPVRGAMGQLDRAKVSTPVRRWHARDTYDLCFTGY
jgi:hypothetical protein